MILIEVELAGHMTRFAVPVPRVPVVGDSIQLFRDDYPADVEQVVLYASFDAETINVADGFGINPYRVSGYPVARVVVRTAEGSPNWREDRLLCRVNPPGEWVETTTRPDAGWLYDRYDGVLFGRPPPDDDESVATIVGHVREPEDHSRRATFGDLVGSAEFLRYAARWGDAEAKRLMAAVNNVCHCTPIQHQEIVNVALDHGPPVVPHLVAIARAAVGDGISVKDAAVSLFGPPA